MPQLIKWTYLVGVQNTESLFISISQVSDGVILNSTNGTNEKLSSIQPNCFINVVQQTKSSNFQLNFYCCTQTKDYV